MVLSELREGCVLWVESPELATSVDVLRVLRELGDMPAIEGAPSPELVYEAAREMGIDALVLVGYRVSGESCCAWLCHAGGCWRDLTGRDVSVALVA